MSGLNQIKTGKILLILSLLVSTLFPGFLIIFIYLPEVFSNENIIKIIILSLSFTTPFYLINIFISGAILSKADIDAEKEVLGNLILFFAALITLLIICFPIIILRAPFFPFDLELAGLITIIVVFQTLIIILLRIDKKLEDDKKEDEIDGGEMN